MFKRIILSRSQPFNKGNKIENLWALIIYIFFFFVRKKSNMKHIKTVIHWLFLIIVMIIFWYIIFSLMLFFCLLKASTCVPCGSTNKESTCNEGDLGSIPVLERSPGEGKGYPLQYSGLENSMDSIVYGVAKSQI